MSQTFQVSASMLHLRSKPLVSASTRLALLPQGHRLRKLADAQPMPWWHVETSVDSVLVRGFVNSLHLVSDQEPSTTAALSELGAAHLEHSKPVARHVDGRRPFRLNEGGQPTRNQGLLAIAEWLDVEHSLRYLPQGATTFCNVYAYDFACLSGVYLPRVWWTPAALQALALGKPVTPVYGQTVRELTANALHDWFADHGAFFGWRRVLDLDALQQAVNAGAVAMIVARRVDLNRSGHIVAVLPESATLAAQRNAQGRVTIPVQSQAGADNAQQFVRLWWTAAKFASFAFWLHD